ncbi:unnamed protein product [Ceutorhynchus assimilis]|uniref:Uncharacterized protein n=1 Tax=Ceutorhynchus assimilis TaxID=467358 RepID=A0A9N9MPM6_9CUCU|nr:unnamed protein product [Ceutorhynchus assimilis]
MPKLRESLSSQNGPSLTVTESVPTMENETFRDSHNLPEYQNLAIESAIEETLPIDQPDYVHVTNLAKQSKMDETTVISDEDDSDDDAVVFIDIAYKQPDEEPARRRNPVRKIRSKRGYLKNEHILEEDFHVLDQIDQPNSIAFRSKPSQSKSITGNKLYKKWPVNSCEMPFYNPATLQIEAIQVPEYVPKIVKRKPKPRLFVRQRRPRCSKGKVEVKYPVETLKDLVSESLVLIEDFIKKSGDQELEDLLKNQKSLKALVTSTVKGCL